MRCADCYFGGCKTAIKGTICLCLRWNRRALETFFTEAPCLLWSVVGSWPFEHMPLMINTSKRLGLQAILT